MLYRIVALVSSTALCGCSPPPDPPGVLCDDIRRTPLAEATDWTGPDAEDIVDALVQVPIRVDWDLFTLDVASSELSLTLDWSVDAIDVVEADCPEIEPYLEAPLVLSLDLAQGGVVGTLAGELTLGDVGLGVRTQGEVRAIDPWTTIGETFAGEQVEGDVVRWNGTVTGPWNAAKVRIDAVSASEERDRATVLWNGHWVLAE